MKTKNKIFLSLVTIMFLSSSSFADENKNDLGEVEVINDNITENSDSYTMDFMRSATKLNLPVLNTPQSISVITSQQMEDFNLNTLNDVLDNTTGIEVQRMESDRTQYTSRGFNITNFLIDGVGSSLADNYIYGNVDMFLYDHVEVTRGATGLSSNHGDPSASINMVRKRPTKDFQASTKISLGSWNKKRLEVDVSNSLNDDKSIRARVMGAIEDTKSHLDRNESKLHVFSAIIDGDINDNNKVTLGIKSAKNDVKGTQQGGFNSTDLQAKNYDISTNAAPDWSYRNTDSKEIFLDLDSILSDKWKLKTSYRKENNEGENHVGIFTANTLTTSMLYNSKTDADLFDVTLNGSYTLFDNEHEVVFSANYIKQKYTLDVWMDFTDYAIDFNTWDGSTSSRTYAVDPNSVTDWTLTEKSFSAANNFNITNSLSVLLGGKFSRYEKEGLSYSKDFSQKDNSVFTPYASLIYKINDNISAYTSYTTTFNPQDKIDAQENQLDPEEGINYEAGIKSSFFEEALNSSFAVFRSKKDNVADEAGKLSDGVTSYYKGEDGVVSQGYEIEVSGKLSDNINASLGYTKLSIKDKDGKDYNTYIPRKMINAAVSYSPTQVKGLKVGVSANWKSAAYHSIAPDVVQRSYTIFNLMSSYAINKKTDLSFNVNNVTNKKYLNSLYKRGFAINGAPRSFGVSLAYKF